MKITGTTTDKVTLEELGRRLARTRLERNLTQAELAAEAGVSKPTLERLEAGETTALSTFLRIIRALGLLDALDRLVPEPTPSPIERLKLEGKKRRRASGSRGSGQSVETVKPWTWGDEHGTGTP
jgi:transcriptional regulator with XRE-family HTH domain